jgi:endonuclease/exonuclease/phosphatase family metal-dependent hydrolase
MRTLPLLVAVALVAPACARLNRPDPRSTAVESGGRATPAAAAGAGLRVLTYNVHGQTAGAIAAAVRGDPALARADLIFMQEVEEHPRAPVSRVVARRLGMAWAYAPGYGLSDGGSHGVAILSRFPLRDLQVIPLPRHHVLVNSGRRAALGATVDTPSGPLRVYSVHLDNRINPADRVRQLEPVVDAAAHQPIERVIIAGDLNTSPFRWLAAIIPVPVGGQLGRVEGWVRAHGYTTPAHASGQTSQWLNMRLDAVYVRGLRGGSVGVEQDVRISDHFPLWVDLTYARSRRVPLASR